MTVTLADATVLSSIARIQRLEGSRFLLVSTSEVEYVVEAAQIVSISV